MSPFSPDQLLRRVLTTEGMLPILSHSKVSTEQILQSCEEVTEWYEDHPEGQGFGSSDMTYAVKSVIDLLIRVTEIPYFTEFNPMLRVTNESK